MSCGIDNTNFKDTLIEMINEIGAVCATKWFLAKSRHLSCKLNKSSAFTVLYLGFLAERNVFGDRLHQF
jgi:hypothetical protein